MPFSNASAEMEMMQFPEQQHRVTRETENQVGERELGDQPSLALTFTNKISQPVYTGKPIKGENGTSIEMRLVDAVNGEVINSRPEASSHVVIEALPRDFNSAQWKFVRGMEGMKSILRGELRLDLTEGIGTLRKIWFPHTRKWMNKGKFRLVARVIDNFDGTRVGEAKSEFFTVKDGRAELDEKYEIPSPSDPVSRLRNISRRGAIFERLRKYNVTKVQEFLNAYHSDCARLQRITGMTGNKFKETVAHALKCSEQLGGMVHIYNPSPSFNSRSCSSSLFYSGPPQLESPGGRNNWTNDMIDAHGTSQACSSSMGIISSMSYHPSSDPCGDNNGNSYTIEGYELTQPLHSSLAVIPPTDLSVEDFEVCDMFLTPSPSVSPRPIHEPFDSRF